MKIDTKNLSCELVRALRGKLSQGQLNKKLNFETNQLHRWEKGHSRISWNEFTNLADVLDINLPHLFTSYFRFNDNHEDIPKFLKHLFAGQSVGRIGKKVGITEGKLRRIFKGDTEINLDDFLKILFSLDPMESMAFSHDLVGNQKLPSLVSEKKRIDSFVKEYYSNPDLGLLLVCLTLPGYKKLNFHRDSWLSEASGISITEVHRLLSLTLKTGLTNKEKGKYILSTFKMSDRGGRSDMLKVRKHWMARAIKKIGKHSKRDAFGSLVFTTSNQARDKIIARYLRFFEELKEIVEEDKSEHEVSLVMNFHLFNPGLHE